MSTLKLGAALAALAALAAVGTAARAPDEADADCAMADAEVSMNTTAVSASNFHDTRYTSWPSVSSTISGLGAVNIFLDLFLRIS